MWRFGLLNGEQGQGSGFHVVGMGGVVAHGHDGSHGRVDVVGTSYGKSCRKCTRLTYK